MSGEVIVDGKLLLPVATRVWVELFPAASAADADPVARAELYLGPGGAFETEALNASGGPEFRVVITSHFTRSWQAQEVLSAVGAGGMKLPKSALKADKPRQRTMAGHLEYAGVVKVTDPDLGLAAGADLRLDPRSGTSHRSATDEDRMEIHGLTKASGTARCRAGRTCPSRPGPPPRRAWSSGLPRDDLA